MSTQKQKVGGSNKKKGRNIAKCADYKARNVRMTNKRRKVAKHLIANPNDIDAKRSV